MKKIMFNDKYGLTQAVLKGRKTITRRVISQIQDFDEVGIWDAPYITICRDGRKMTDVFPAYQVGEEVAVAQNYEQAGWNPDTLQQAWVKNPTIFPDLDEYKPLCGWVDLPLKYHKGWTNKMFILAGLMPHRIRITGIKVERLQDISEEDIYREGFEKQSVNNGWGNAAWHWETMLTYMDDLGRYKEIRSREPQEAFACLIDKVSGYGTWESNPLVWVYEFELIK